MIEICISALSSNISSVRYTAWEYRLRPEVILKHLDSRFQIKSDRESLWAIGRVSCKIRIPNVIDFLDSEVHPVLTILWSFSIWSSQILAGWTLPYKIYELALLSAELTRGLLIQNEGQNDLFDNLTQSPAVSAAGWSGIRIKKVLISTCFQVTDQRCRLRACSESPLVCSVTFI